MIFCDQTVCDRLHDVACFFPCCFSLINDDTAAIANVVPDVAGQYVAQLIVNDGQEDSAPNTALVTIEVGNRPPIADAGLDQEVPAGLTVVLDGTASFDPDGDGLIFTWSLTSIPPSSIKAAGRCESSAPVRLSRH